MELTAPRPAAQTRFLVGLIGADVGGSLSRPLHEREAAELGLRLFYQPIEVGDRPSGGELSGLIRTARRMGFRGLNVTHPCKQAVLPYLDRLSPDATALGAVNTIVFAGDEAVGYNTDWAGFGESLATGLPGVARDHVIQLGAGGAGAAVGYALLRSGTRVLTLVDPAPDRAARLARVLADQFGADRVVIGDGSGPADGLVNASPIGMTAYPGVPVPVERLRRDMWVADIIYRPAVTALLRRARDLGCRTLAGSGMLALQAAHGFELFTGHRPDSDRMLRHVEALTA
ncbi:shikimate dehydrogenase [Actinoplanes sp. NPDC023936]|uniref:shikimate dehydrogenase n=1 Tax=Actinoplanes sp. NPDC023936 TaxID=3154910 RepID=UPI00340F8C1A